MESQRYLFLLVILMCILGSSQAYNFFVGGKDGWVLKPSEGYSHWAKRNRFQVNDSLIFKYKKGSDSVLVVSKDNYYNCNKAKPMNALQDGDSVFKFDKSGPFFFISGQADNCEKGQKLAIVVLAPRNTTHKAPTPAPSPTPKAPSASPKAKNPKADSPKSTETPAYPPVFDSPAPAPAPSAAPAFGGSVGFVLGSIVVLGCFFGLV